MIIMYFLILVEKDSMIGNFRYILSLLLEKEWGRILRFVRSKVLCAEKKAAITPDIAAVNK